MGSERLNNKSQFRQHLDLDGVDIAQPDLMYAGGITEVKKIAGIADTFHVPISPHNTKGPVGIVAAAHLMASVPNVAPMELVTGIDWRDEIITEPLHIQGGRVYLPEGPGWGIELHCLQFGFLSSSASLAGVVFFCYCLDVGAFPSMS